MSFVMLSFVLISILIIYVTRRFRAGEMPYKRPIKPQKNALRFDSIPDPDKPPLKTPFLLFNKDLNLKPIHVRAGTAITENFHIISGEVAVYPATEPESKIKQTRNDGNQFSNIQAINSPFEPLFVFGPGAITHSCFDLLQIPTATEKRTLTDATLLPLGPGDGYVNLVLFGKTCIEPLVRYFRRTDFVLCFERAHTTDFNSLARAVFGPLASPIRAPFRPSLCLDECLVWIEHGTLVVNGVSFGPGHVFGLLGLLFGCCRLGYRYSAPSGATIHYVGYSETTRVPEGAISLFRDSLKGILIPHPVLLVGLSTRWLRLEPGQLLVEKETPCNSVYLLPNREVGNEECLREIGFSESVVVDSLTDAIEIDRKAIHLLVMLDPTFHRLLMKKVFSKKSSFSKVLLITPATKSCSGFALRLKHVVGCNACLIRRGDVFGMLSGVSGPIGELRITEYLGVLRYKFSVILVYSENEWSRTLRIFSKAADLIYVAGDTPVPNRFDRRNVEFIQLHSERVRPARSFNRLIQMLFKKGESESDSSETEAPSVSPSEICYDPLSSASRGYLRIHHILFTGHDGQCLLDFERLRRHLLGERVGLVLGGGGARGLAHVGVIKALEEENIPVDCVGGTSMGAFVGALYAQQLDFLQTYRQTKKFADSCGSRWNYLLDISYPFVSIFSGRFMDAALESIFKKTKIQDLWIEFYCVTTDLLKQEERVVFTGPVAKWLRASMSICGFLPPAVIRNRCYVDGAYTNNVPFDVMSSLGVSTVIVVDVTSWPDNPPDMYDSCSGLVLLFSKLFGGKNYLSIMEIQYRLAFLSTEQKLRALEEQTFIIRPDLEAYGTTEFKKFDEIVACGYNAAKKVIREWKKKNLIAKAPQKRRTKSL